MSFPKSCRCMLVLTCLSASVAVAGEESCPNAALAYWQAFAMLPPTDKDQDKVLSSALTAPLDKHASALIKQSQGSMKALRRATAMSHCDWGLDFSAGPHVVMPHLSKARQMARFAALHARKQFADGNADTALDVVGDIFVMSRHAGGDDVLISVLVQYAVESVGFGLVAPNLPNLDRDQIDSLSRQLDALPDGGSLLGALKLEQKIYVGWARQVIQNAESAAEAIRQLRTLTEENHESDPDLPDITREQISVWLDGTTKDYEEIFELYDLPPEAFEARWAKLLKRIEASNPFSNTVLPGLKGVRNARDKNAANWALFRAAIGVARDGVDSLASVKDPFGDGPFKYTKLAGGFRLTSQYRFRGEPVELTVGEVEDK